MTSGASNVSNDTDDVTIPREDSVAWASAQESEWQKFVDESLSGNVCPYSGSPGPECKATVCDCFEFEDRWGVSQK